MIKRLDLHFSKKKGIIILVLSFFIILLGVLVTLTPPTYVTTETTDQRTYTLETNHQSTTIENSRLYNEGHVVSNGEQYFTSIHPSLVISFSESYTGEYDLEISEPHSNIQAISTRGETVIWSEEMKISDTDWGQIVDDSTIRINTDKLSNEVNEIDEEIPTNVDIVVNFESEYEFSTEYDDSIILTATPTLRFTSENSYQVDSEPIIESLDTTNNIEVPQPSQSIIIYDIAFGIYGLIIIFLGILSAIIGAYILHGGLYSERTYKERLYEYHKSKYSEWITYGRPMADPEYESVWEKLQVDTLEGLVDVAIDTDKRVIYSKDMSRFYIFSEGTLYTYLPPQTDKNSTSYYGFF